MLGASLGTIAVTGTLLLIVASIIRKLRKGRKNGVSCGRGEDCGSCGHCGK